MKNKYLLLLGMMFFISISYAQQANHRHDLKIITRHAWDKNKKLLSQYDKKVGSRVSFMILDKTRVRQIKEFCYLNCASDSICLKEIFWGIVIHHTTLPGFGSPIEQAKFIRDGQIIDKNYKFSDIAYHFVIASDGTVLEGRPITHMGTHAGKIQEGDKKLDPDYGSIGIVLVGNFDEHEPDKKQLSSLVDLLNFLKEKYHISNNGIFFHNEIKALVENSGLTSLSKEKTCPGHKFPSKDSLLKQLIPDLPQAKQKQIYICK